MDEHVLAIRLRDETKALRLVEPLHGATSHLKLLLYPGPKTRTLPHLTPRRRPVTLTDVFTVCGPPINKKAARKVSGGI
jgi:hypothetical protein